MQQTLALLRAHQECATPQHIAAAFEVMGRQVQALGPHPSPGAQAQQRAVRSAVAGLLTDWGTAGAFAGFTPRELATVLWGCAHLGAVPPRGSSSGGGSGEHSPLLQAVLAAVPAFNAVDWHMVLWAPGKLPALATAEWVAALLAGAAATPGVLQQRWASPHWALAFRAAGVTHAPLPRIWLAELWALPPSALAAWRGQDLSSVIYSLGRQRALPPAQWMRSWYVASARALSGWSSGEVTSAFQGLAALAQLGGRSGGGDSDGLGRSGGSDDLTPAAAAKAEAVAWLQPPPRWLARLWGVLYWTPDQMEGRQLSRLLSCFVALRVQPPPELLERLLAYADAAAQQAVLPPGAPAASSGPATPDKSTAAASAAAEGQQLPRPQQQQQQQASEAAAAADARWRVHLLTALAQLRFQPDSAWSSAWLARLLPGLRGVTPNEVGLLVWALGRLEVPVERRAARPLLRRLERGRSRLQPHVAMLALWGLGRLGLRPPWPWLAAQLAALVPELASARDSSVLALLAGCTALSVRPFGEMVPPLLATLEARAARLSPAGCVAVAQGLAALRLAPGRSLAARLAARVEVLETRQGISPGGVAAFEGAMQQLEALDEERAQLMQQRAQAQPALGQGQAQQPLPSAAAEVVHGAEGEGRQTLQGPAGEQGLAQHSSGGSRQQRWSHAPARARQQPV